MSRDDWEILIRRYTAGELDGPTFESVFLEAWRQAWEAGESVPYAVDLLFYEVDAYCADPALRGPSDLDEDGLRAAARELVERLDEPWPKVPGSPSSLTHDEQMERFRKAAKSLGLMRD